MLKIKKYLSFFTLMFVPATTWGQSANSYYIEASIDLSCSCTPSYTSFGVVYANGQNSTKPFTDGTLSTSFLVSGDIHTFNGGFTLNACNGQPAGGNSYAPEFTPGTYNYSGATPTAACPSAKINFTVDDPVYLSVVALHMDASKTSTFNYEETLKEIRDWIKTNRQTYNIKKHIF